MHSTCTDRLTKAAKRYVSPGTRPLTNAAPEFLFNDPAATSALNSPIL